MKTGKYKRTKEIREKISKKLKGRKLSKKTIEKMKKNRVGMLGKNHSEETKNKIRKTKKEQHLISSSCWKKGNIPWNKNRKMSKKFKLNCRKKQLKYIQNCLNNGLPIQPQMGKHEKRILDELELSLKYKIYRQYHIRDLIYWVDGYIPELNLVIEIDEKGHKYRKEKDLFRQQEIQKILNCDFVRIKDVLD